MPPYAVEPGTRLVDRYRLEEPLGESGGTSWWRATDELLDRPVGVCVLGGDPELSRTVLSAARRAAAVSDARFLRVLDASEDDEYVYVVTEWVRARSLADLLERGPLPAGEAREMAVEIAEALAASHKQGLSHLCLQPEHVLRTAHGQVKVSGLGVDAAVLGLATDDPDEAARRDTRGIASVLYAALTARWPGPEESRLPPAPTDAGELCSPRQVRAGIPDDLDELVNRALGVRQRPDATPVETPQQLADQLASTQTTSRIPVASPRTEREDDRDTPYPPPYVAPYEDRGPGRERVTRVAWVLVVLVLLVGLSLAGWQLMMAALDSPGDSADPTQSPTGSASSSQAASRPLEVASVGTLDPPPGGNGEENDDRVDRVADGDRSTVWTSKSYNDQFGPSGLKEGVGVVLDLGKKQSVREVVVDLEGTGSDVELRAGDDEGTGPDDYEVVAESGDASGRARLRPDEPVEARYLVLWFTSIPSDDGGYRAGVSEVTVRG